jgi:hypothetical protein
MTRRIASWLLLLLLASSGAYAVPAPRLSNSVRSEYSVLRQDRAEVPAPRKTSPVYPAERPSWQPTDSPRASTGIAPDLYQRPPPSV